MLKLEFAKCRQNTFSVLFFKCSFNFRAHAFQSELSKVSIFNFVKFQLQSKSSEIEQAFKNRRRKKIPEKLSKKGY